MIKESELKPNEPMPGINIRQALNLDDVANVLLQENQQYQLPINIERDTIASGSFFNKKETPCLTIRNMEHPTDYFFYVLSLRTLGNMSTITICYSGTSPGTGRIQKAEERSNSISGMLINAIRGDGKEEYQYEEMYYHALDELLKSAFGCV